MHLKAGQKLRWEAVSEREVRIVVEANPLKALGFGAALKTGAPRITEEWMCEIREGE